MTLQLLGFGPTLVPAIASVALAFLSLGFVSKACAADELSRLDAAGGVITGPGLEVLASEGRTSIRLTLDATASFDLRVHFNEAPFSGTRMDVKVNGRRLLPYFAFGGDTRYDSVRGQPGMRPPIAEIEGRWLIPPDLFRVGENLIELATTGVLPNDVLNEIGPPPRIVVDRIELRPVDGGDLPQYANSIYYDFAVWPQGYHFGRGGKRRVHYDNALLGIVGGKGMPNVIPGLGSDQAGWEAKRAAEALWIDWGYRNFEFYTIWSFCGEPELWARFVNVDGDSATQSHFHTQTIFKNVLERTESATGADILLYDIQKWTSALEPAIRQVAPYATYYNFKCEQHGPWGQGFGDDGQVFAALGYDGEVWARNYYAAMKAARDLVQKYDAEDGRVEEQNHWIPAIRTVLFDTALRRGEPMRDMIDILTTHFGSLASYDLDENGRAVPGDTLRLQYPGAIAFNSGWRDEWIGHVAETGIRWVKDSMYPETAIDFNRYRLGRCKADMHMHSADPAMHRWGNGRPFDYRAGFRGDELMHNSENGIWQGYSAPSPYQFLQGTFACGLLPTGAAEPRDLSITTRQSLTETAELNVNVYGHWIDGVGHTKRLRTVDPLYGDLFGWTGNEHCNSGDYIRMVGIKDHHHRRQPYDAFNLVRRICYAFITSGSVYPSWLGDRHDDELFVKTLLQAIEGRAYLCVYAANFADVPQTLDVLLPLDASQAGQAMVFDERSWDWAVHERRDLSPGREQRFSHETAPLSAWMVAIPIGPDALASALDLPPAPSPTAPVVDEHEEEDRPVLRFEPPLGTGQRQQIEVAREARFRGQDRIELSAPATMTGQHKMATMPAAGQRLWWRVRTVQPDGRGGPWSSPQAFIYKWPEYAERFTSQPRADRNSWRQTPAWDWLDQTHETEEPSLTWEGEIYGSNGHMNSPSRAADGQAESFWSNETNGESSQFASTPEWAVIWPQPRSFSLVKVLWHEELMPKEFVVQISDDAQAWTNLLARDGNIEPLTTIELNEPVTALYFRITILSTSSETGRVAIREVMVK